MPRVKLRTDPARVATLARLLGEAWPDATCEVAHQNAFQLLVGTILAAQSTDKMINTITPALFARYPDARALAAADPAVVEQMIFKSGFFRAKTRSIIGMARALVEHHRGEVPRTMAELCALPGVARKTANVVLGTAFGIADGVVVDTHVTRLAARLGLTRETDPVKIEDDLIRILPKARVDHVPEPPDLARPPRVRRQGAGLRSLHARAALPERAHPGGAVTIVPKVAVGAIVLDGDRVLLVERGAPPGAGLWSVPGGKVEPGERLAAAVVREVAEETGLAVTCGALVEVVERIGADHHYVIHDHLAHLVGPATEPVAGDDVRAARWVAFADVAHLPVTDGLVAVLARARALASAGARG